MEDAGYFGLGHAGLFPGLYDPLQKGSVRLLFAGASLYHSHTVYHESATRPKIERLTETQVRYMLGLSPTWGQEYNMKNFLLALAITTLLTLVVLSPAAMYADGTDPMPFCRHGVDRNGKACQPPTQFNCHKDPYSGCTVCQTTHGPVVFCP